MLDKKATTEKILSFMDKAGARKCNLVVFGEALLPGYPFWLSLTGGAAFDSPVQKELHAHYMRNAVNLDSGDLDDIKARCKKHQMAMYLGLVERAVDRGGHSLYCSLVHIDKQGEVRSVHRKLQPTYEERLTWSPGDGHGLCVHELEGFRVGGLNCWENWMPLSRAALYGQGENLHVAVWPGTTQNTSDITRFIARESRSYVVSVSGLMRKEDFPSDTPHLEKILQNAPVVLANGGSCMAGPDGNWVLEPVADKEGLFEVEIDLDRVYQERQNFDPSGHYSRPDVTSLNLNTERQGILKKK
jgi:nitrilase